MSKKTVTLIGLALAPALILLVDVIFVRSAPGDVFESLYTVVRGTAVLAWPVGVLLGHWYSPGALSPVLPRPLNYFVLTAVSLVVMLGSFAFLALPGFTNVVSTVSVLLGFVAGVLLWSAGSPTFNAKRPRVNSRGRFVPTPGRRPELGFDESGEETHSTWADKEANNDEDDAPQNLSAK